jgi:hypothetical protein
VVVPCHSCNPCGSCVIPSHPRDPLFGPKNRALNAVEGRAPRNPKANSLMSKALHLPQQMSMAFLFLYPWPVPWGPYLDVARGPGRGEITTCGWLRFPFQPRIDHSSQL